MSTCTPVWSARACAKGWQCLCCTSHVPNAELGFTVWCSWQLREMLLHPFLPEEEGNWKESGNGKSHMWEAGVHETPAQSTVCCLPGTNWGSRAPVPKENRQAFGLGGVLESWLGLLNGLKLWSHYWQCSAGTFVWHMAHTQAAWEFQGSQSISRNKNCAVERFLQLVLMNYVIKDLIQGTVKSREDLMLHSVCFG